MHLLVEGLDRLGWNDMFPRQFKQGDCEGWCGESFIVLVSRPFTAEEDAGFNWIMEQDTVQLAGVMPLADGRDLMMFDRQHTKQSKSEAKREQVMFIKQRMSEKNIKVDVVVE